MTFKKPFIISVLWLGLAGFSSTLVVLGGLYLYLSPKLPAVETLRDVKLQTPLRVYSSDGKLIGEYGEKRRNPIRYSDIPEAYVKAILAAEDDQFYSHIGVSIKGLLRASSQLLLTGHIQSGGSTITMQVARNFFLTRHQTFARKFNEILLALQIERELTKEEILELYVNVIFLGNRAYGIQSAAKVYYGKDISELNLAQLAMIAGLPKAPSAYNPIVNPSRALIRRNWILGRMQALDYIDQAAYDMAVAEPVTAKYHGLDLELNAPYIAEMARKKAIEEFGESVYTDGYQIYTTVDSRLQKAAQQAVINGLLTYDQRHGYRGPEQRLERLPYLANAEAPAGTTGGGNDATAEATPAADSNTAADNGLPRPDFTPWKKALNAIPVYAGLKPAAVIRVGDTSVQALLADGRIISIGWQQGLAQARPYYSENRRGSKPKQAQDVLQIGDVIRVAQRQDKWHLYQVPTAQAALVALNPDNGAIVSLVGGFDFDQSHFNRATQAERQPGSNFKPFIYTAALENGFTPATVIIDAPIVFDDASLEGTWRPVNSSGKFYGPTRLRQALYKSRNLVSIRVLNSIGIQQAISGMDRYGFDKEHLPHDLSLALGSYALTPLQVATGYAVFANGGYKVEPWLVDRIVNVEGEVIYQAKPLTVCRKCEDFPAKKTDAARFAGEGSEEAFESTDDTASADRAFTEEPAAAAEPALPRAPKVLDERVAYMIDSMLRDVVKKGTGTRANVLQRGDLAGKTGTTNGPRDAWFSGYNHHIVATTWLGFDQNSLLGLNEYGGSAALPIWIDFMRTALQGVPEVMREQPDGIVTVSIDPKTGKRALPGSKDAIFEIFRADNLPELADVNDAGTSSSHEEAPPDELF